jgi:hypothetical protein
MISERGTGMQEHLNNHHRETLRKIFSHPASGNLEWRQVLSLLDAVGTTHEEHNGKVKVTLGPETEVVVHPRGKDVDKQMVVDLRRMLAGAGFSPDGTPEVKDGRSRDHGDGRWGEPT